MQKIKMMLYRFLAQRQSLAWDKQFLWVTPKYGQVQHSFLE